MRKKNDKYTKGKRRVRDTKPHQRSDGRLLLWIDYDDGLVQCVYQWFSCLAVQPLQAEYNFHGTVSFSSPHVRLCASTACLQPIFAPDLLIDEVDRQIKTHNMPADEKLHPVFVIH